MNLVLQHVWLKLADNAKNCSHREECLFYDSKITDQNDYIESVFGHIADPAKKDQAIENALKIALEIRKFEIDLYWKRATYFCLGIYNGFFCWLFLGASTREAKYYDR